jgi:GR25 family glycosyltransferase involved in LPS biosynthesis
MNHIDKVFVINLEKRKDRLDQFTEEYKKIIDDNKLERFDAIYRPDHGCLGCTLSHLEVIKQAKKCGYKKIIIFEDDFQFIIDQQTFHNNLRDFFDLNLDFKVCMLSYNIMNSEVYPYNDLLRITTNVQTASGYIVNSDYFDELIDCLSYGATQLEKTHQHWNYINDQVWKSLQKDRKWFIFNERMGIQRESYSDLAGKIVNHGV